MSGTTTSSSAFNVVLADDFSDGYKVENWGYAYHGGTYWNGAFEWNRDDVAVRDGTMQVTVTRHADGSWTTGGFNSFKAGKTITYGTIEFDGKVEESQGTMGVFLTWPESDTWPVDGEIDILETPGQDVMHTTHWEDAASGEHWYDSVRNQSYDETQWNHYKLTWLPDRMTLEVNGNVVAEWTDPVHIPDVAHGIGAMGFVASANEAWVGGAPDGSTPDVTTIYMDNVVMSQWNGGEVVPPPPPPPPPPEPVRIEFGTGADTLELKISQDAYQGSAQYTVSVDGVQMGDTFTASAWRSAGQSDTLVLRGDWGPGEHQVSVRFLNDAWGGSAATDRNLHLDGATYNGQALAGASAALMDAGAAAFSFTEEAPSSEPVVPPEPVRIEEGTGPDALVLKVSQDAYQGSAQYTVSVDGVQVGDTFTASAWRSAGQSDTLTLRGDWGPGEHRVEVRFLNDRWDGSAETDRNLHLDGATYNGQALEGASAALMDAGAAAFSFAEAAPPPPPPPLEFGAGPDALVLKVSQDAYQGDAQYTVSVDGVQIGGTFTASASHAAGQSDTLTLRGDWGPGEHQVSVRFLNDAWGGSAATDRNLHLDGATYNGQALEGASATLWDAGAVGFSFAEEEAPAPVVRTGTAGADLFEAEAAGGTFTGGGGRDLFVFEAGDGRVTVTDFAPRTDKLVFVDLDREDVATAAATEGGADGLLVTYGGEGGGAVFLAGVAELGPRDMIFA